MLIFYVQFLMSFWLVVQGEQMQKDMNIDTLPPAIVHESKQSSEFRSRSGSVHSNITVETNESEGLDPEIVKALHEFDVSDSPTISLRKKIG